MYYSDIREDDNDDYDKDNNDDDDDDNDYNNDDDDDDYKNDDDYDLQRAMAAEAEASREARAKVLRFRIKKIAKGVIAFEVLPVVMFLFLGSIFGIIHASNLVFG